MGYYRAGFDDIIGVDIEPMPRYPFHFIQGDALEYLAAHGAEYDVIHASPVCKGYSRLSALWRDREYPDDIAPVRELLRKTGKPYIIENVVGAPLSGVMLCGSMFGLRVYRHRIFETNPQILLAPASCNHWARASGNRALKQKIRVTPNLNDYDILTVTGHDFILKDALIAIFESIDDLARAKKNISITTVIAVGLMLLIIVPLYILTVSRTIGPIRELSRASKAVAEGKLDQYVPVRTRDEVGELS